MRLLIENGTVLTMNAADQILDPGWVEVVDGAIARVSATPIDPAGADRRINASGKLVMPGLVNAHTHLFQTLIRGVYEQLPFTEWLRCIYHCGRALTADDCYIGAMLGSLESLRSGVTTLVVDGRILMETGQVLDSDESRLLREGQVAGRRLVGRLG